MSSSQWLLLYVWSISLHPQFGRSYASGIIKNNYPILNRFWLINLLYFRLRSAFPFKYLQSMWKRGDSTLPNLGLGSSPYSNRNGHLLGNGDSPGTPLKSSCDSRFGKGSPRLIIDHVEFSQKNVKEDWFCTYSFILHQHNRTE